VEKDEDILLTFFFLFSQELSPRQISFFSLQQDFDQIKSLFFSDHLELLKDELTSLYFSHCGPNKHTKKNQVTTWN